jgi:hypothetical protein
MTYGRLNGTLDGLYKRLTLSERRRLLARLLRTRAQAEIDQLGRSTPPEHVAAWNHAFDVWNDANGVLPTLLLGILRGAQRDAIALGTLVLFCSIDDGATPPWLEDWDLDGSIITTAERFAGLRAELAAVEQVLEAVRAEVFAGEDPYTPEMGEALDRARGEVAGFVALWDRTVEPLRDALGPGALPSIEPDQQAVAELRESLLRRLRAAA